MSNSAKDLKKKYGDVVLPKKPMSGYICYTTHNVNRVKEEHKIPHTEAMSKCGELWNKLPANEKKKYDDMHDKDVIRYENQLKELEKKGYFTMEDGSKSSDHTPKVKKQTAKNDPKDDKVEKIKPKKKKKEEKKVEE